MSRFFETMPPLERRRTARLLAVCPKVELAAGETLCHDAFPQAALLVVKQGIVALASASRGGRRMILAFATEGSVLPPPRSDELVSGLTEAALIAVTPAARRALLEQPLTAEAVVAGLLDALSERQESLTQFANVVHGDRLREKLLQLARRHGAAVDGGISIELPLTHELLGQAIGSARETVTTSLRTLEYEGFFVRDGRSYRLTAPLAPHEM